MFCKILMHKFLYLMLLFVISCETEKTIIQPQTDTQPPTVEWVFPTSSDTLADIVAIQFAAFDNEGVDSVVTYLDGRSPEGWRSAVNDDTLYSFIWNTAETQDGQHILEARAWDFSGNLGISPSLLVRVKNSTDPPPEDDSPPVVSWHFPEPGSVVSGEVELMFNTLDDVGIDIVKIFINGANPDGYELAGHAGAEYSFMWETELFPDGSHSIEVIARDMAGNIGSAPAIWLEVLNHPDIQRVIWVPDDYETIQGAIDASEDGDTVRVRAGVYYEGLRMMGKNIWLESEDGPEETIIIGENRNDGVRVVDQEDWQRTSIRGFTITSEYTCVQIQRHSGLTILNCIMIGTWDNHGIWSGQGNFLIRNCIIDFVDLGLNTDYSFGFISNTIIINCNVGFRKAGRWEEWVTYGWDLFWNNQSNYSPGMSPRESDVFADPLFIDDSYQLRNNSPAIDAGNPEILDLDGTRSDIGVYGGPNSY